MTGSTRTKINGTRTRLLLAAMTLLLVMAVPVFAQEMKVPETAKDHHEMGEHYQKVAAQTREDIEMHKKMLADFNQAAVKSPKTGENPYSKKMRLHCDKYIKASEALAAERTHQPRFITSGRRSWRVSSPKSEALCSRSPVKAATRGCNLRHSHVGTVRLVSLTT